MTYGCRQVIEYVYELRRGSEVVATGRWSSEKLLQVGERVVIGGHAGIVTAVEPLLAHRELRLVVDLMM